VGVWKIPNFTGIASGFLCFCHTFPATFNVYGGLSAMNPAEVGVGDPLLELLSHLLSPFYEKQRAPFSYFHGWDPPPPRRSIFFENPLA